MSLVKPVLFIIKANRSGWIRFIWVGSIWKDLVATNSLDSANVLIVTGNRNREILVQMLEDIGHAIVDTLPIYETDFTDIKDAPDYEKFLKVGADGIIFTSSSTALSYIEQEEDIILEDDAISPAHCSFGPETSKTLRENDLEVRLECTNPSVEEMISKVVDQFGH